MTEPDELHNAWLGLLRAIGIERLTIKLNNLLLRLGYQPHIVGGPDEGSCRCSLWDRIRGNHPHCLIGPKGKKGPAGKGTR